MRGLGLSVRRLGAGVWVPDPVMRLPEQAMGELRTSADILDPFVRRGGSPVPEADLRAHAQGRRVRRLEIGAGSPGIRMHHLGSSSEAPRSGEGSVEWHESALETNGGRSDDG